MPFPLEVSFRGLDRSKSLEDNVRDHAVRLGDFCDRITSCHVVLEMPHRHHHQGNVYQVRIHLAVPRRELVADRETGNDHAHEDPYVAVRDAFKAIRRQLEDYVREVRGDVKTHAAQLHGRITRLLPELNCGFIETSEGREVYFHRNSVLNDLFEQLPIGANATFTEEQGVKGAQACGVRIVPSKRSALPGEVGEGAASTIPAYNGRPLPKTTPLPVDDVRLRAYQRWEAAGRPIGDGVSYWLEAERELSQGK